MLGAKWMWSVHRRTVAIGNNCHTLYRLDHFPVLDPSALSPFWCHCLFFAHLPPTYIFFSTAFSLILPRIVSLSCSSQLSLIHFFFTHFFFTVTFVLFFVSLPRLLFILLFPLRLIPALSQHWYRAVFVILGLFVDN